MDDTTSARFAPIEFRTRFLYMFHYRHAAVQSATAAVLAGTVEAWDGEPALSLWNATEPEVAYQDELLDHCADYLFGQSGGSGCAYFRANLRLLNRWFNGCEVIIPNGKGETELRLPLSGDTALELFLSDYGAGILSLTLAPKLPPNIPTIGMVEKVNHALAHPWREPHAFISKPHPRNTDVWTKLSEGARKVMPPAPDDSVPGLPRMGRPGSQITISELCEGSALLHSRDIVDGPRLLEKMRREAGPLYDYLWDQPSFGDGWTGLDPENAEVAAALNRALRQSDLMRLAATSRTGGCPVECSHLLQGRLHGEARVRCNRELLERIYPGEFTPYHSANLLSALEPFGLRRAHDRISVYTTVRFKSDVDFDRQEVREALGESLARLAQVEESGHAGGLSGECALANTLLNRRHWTAVGHLGVAHICADQPDNHTYNPHRLPRIMQKYFIPFLLASLQRLTLESMAGEASAIVHSAKRNASEIGALRQLFLQFRLNGYFSRISSREVVQRYYRLCRQGLDVEASMAALDDAFAEIDARQASDLQLQLSRDMERNLSAMVRLQGSTDAHLHLMEGIQVKLEIVEILIFFVYGAELGHLLLPESHSYGMGLLFVLGGSGALGTLGWLLMWPSWHHYMKHRRTRVHADPMRPELAESATSEASRIGKPGTTGSMTAAAPDGIQHEMQPAAGTIGNGIEARIPPESRGK